MRSASGSMRCPSRPRKSWRRCAVRAKASRLGMGRLDFPKSPTRRASKWNRHPRNWTLLRLPRFKYLRPKTAREAARMAADLGPHAMFVAGGTDLFPKLKRRQFEVDALIGLDFLSHAIHRGEDETVVDAGVTLAAPEGERQLPVAALYRDDGIDYLAKQPAEVVTSLRLPAAGGTRTAYVKLRRRGSIDFPIAGAAVALRLDGSTVTSCRIVLSAVASHPLEADEASEFMVGKQGDEESIRAAAEIAGRPAKPLDNADLSHFWRKRMVRVVVEQALRSAIDQ